MEPALDPAPLILTLALEERAQASFDRLRAAHFPAHRNLLSAHVTLFHHLPGSEAGDVLASVAAICRATVPFPVAVTGLRSLGRGVAFTLAAPELARLRADLARRWAPWLTRQDQQTFRPHVTVQNKVDPATAAATLRALQAGFAPFDVEGRGLQLWRYRGGPWEPVGKFTFAAACATGAAGQD